MLDLIVGHDTCVIDESGRIFSDNDCVDLTLLSQMDLVDGPEDFNLLGSDTNQHVHRVPLI